MENTFKLLMIGAMYENGGNTTHRFLDGHPQLYVYPFESQLGTRLVHDHLTSTFPQKYRWPVFDLSASAHTDYKMIIDEECKVRSRTPHVSKFRHTKFVFSDDERCGLYVKKIAHYGRSRPTNVQAFYESTFEVWQDYKRTQQQIFYVGYSPIITIDAHTILDEMPNAHFLHVVRNPWSAYADTKKRPVPLSLENYMLCWNLNQYYALLNVKRYPSRFHIVRTEDVMADAKGTLGQVLTKMGLAPADSLATPTFNGEELKEVYPWGTIRQATPASNRATAAELNATEHGAIRDFAWQYLEVLDYKDFLSR